MTVRERFNKLTSDELAEELKRINAMRDWCSELEDDSCMAAYLDSEYGNNRYSDEFENADLEELRDFLCKTINESGSRYVNFDIDCYDKNECLEIIWDKNGKRLSVTFTNFSKYTLEELASLWKKCDARK